MSETKLTLSQKMVKIYEEIDHIEKTGRNKTQNYSYVRSADVLRAIRTAFLKYNIWAQTNFEFISEYQIPTRNDGRMFSVRVKAIITLHDADSNETAVISGLGDGADSGDKGVYKAQTGAIKNALRNGSLIPDEADPEADERVDEQVEEPRSGAVRRGPPAHRQVSDAPPERHGSRPSAPEPPVPEAEFVPEAVVPQEAKPTPVELNMPSAGGVLPDKNQLDKYRTAIIDLQKELADYGGLKPSRGLTVSRKILLYLLQTAGTKEANQITITQWDALFAFVNQMKATEGGLGKLAKLIDAAAKPKKE